MIVALHWGGVMHGVRIPNGEDFVSALSGRAIAESLKEKLDPKSVVDVGCGSGGLLFELRNLGIACMGLAYADAALHLCRERGLAVEKLDLGSSSIRTKGMRLGAALAHVLVPHYREAGWPIERVLTDRGTRVFVQAPPTKSAARFLRLDGGPDDGGRCSRLCARPPRPPGRVVHNSGVDRAAELPHASLTTSERCSVDSDRAWRAGES